MSTVTDTDERCGTYAGYQAHRRRRETPCAACRSANATYIAEQRRANRDSYDWNQETKNARDRALRRLAKLYPDVMRALYEEELRAMGRRLVP